MMDEIKRTSINPLKPKASIEKHVNICFVGYAILHYILQSSKNNYPKPLNFAINIDATSQDYSDQRVILQVVFSISLLQGP
jgi:hypothetical protein